MSVGRRRVISWAGTGLLALLLNLLWRFVPGAGGPADEIRWFLARDHVPASAYYRAHSLLTSAKLSDTMAPARILGRLLDDPDPRVVRGALILLDDRLRERERCPLRDAMEKVFLDWFTTADADTKIACLQPMLRCISRQLSGTWYSVRYPPGWQPKREDYRWIIAGTLLPGEERYLADIFTFNLNLDLLEVQDSQVPTRWGDWLSRTLHKLDGWREPSTYSPASLTAGRPDTGSPADGLRLPLQLLHELCHDPREEVRWAAGRLLALTGDPAGLPAFCEWLDHNPQRRAMAERIMADLFGPDWRKHCESGRPTRVPGQGDGGG